MFNSIIYSGNKERGLYQKSFGIKKNMDKQVFIGSSNESIEIAEKIALFLEELSGKPILWNDVFKPGEYTLEDLTKVSEQVSGAIFVFNEDDKTWCRGLLNGTVRDNVLFECGLFLGKLSRTQVIFICNDKPKIPSDLMGITYINYKETQQYTLKKHLSKWLSNLPIKANNNFLAKGTSAILTEEVKGFEYTSLTSGVYTHVFSIKPNVKDYRYHQTRYSWGFGGDLKASSINDYDFIVDSYRDGEYNAYTFRLSKSLTPESPPYKSGINIEVTNSNELYQMYISTPRCFQLKTKLWIKIPSNMQFKKIIIKRFEDLSEYSPFDEVEVYSENNYFEYECKPPKCTTEYSVLEWEVIERA